MSVCLLTGGERCVCPVGQRNRGDHMNADSYSGQKINTGYRESSPVINKASLSCMDTKRHMDTCSAHIHEQKYAQANARFWEYDSFN